MNNENIKKQKINNEKKTFLKKKFNILRKIKPLKTKIKFKEKNNFNQNKMFDEKNINISEVWEKNYKKRTLEERFYYKKEVRNYYKYFFLYLLREIKRIRWTPRKQLNNKFIMTIFFITILALFFYAIDWLLLFLLPLLKII